MRAAHIVEERAGRAQTMNSRHRAQAIERFKTGSTQVVCCDIPSIRLGHSLEAASCVIARRMSASDRRREARQVSRDLAEHRGDAALIQPSEVSGYGSSATWRRAG